MTPIQVRILSTVGVIAALVVWSLPDLLRPTAAPLKPGGRIIYGVSEVEPTNRKAYALRVSLFKRPSGFLEIQAKADHGEHLVKVTPDLQPEDLMDAIEFPLALGGALQPGSLWLQSGDREIGGMSVAGQVKRIVTYKSHKAYEVEGIDGGNRYFELDTGLLVGFEVTIGRREIVGSLLSIK